jgi:hypothetical protein
MRQDDVLIASKKGDVHVRMLSGDPVHEEVNCPSAADAPPAIQSTQMSDRMMWIVEIVSQL